MEAEQYEHSPIHEQAIHEVGPVMEQTEQAVIFVERVNYIVETQQ